MSSGTRRAMPGCARLVGIVDPLSQELALGGVGGEFERSLVSGACLMVVAEFAEEFCAGRVVEVVATERRGEGFHLGECGARPGDVAQGDCAVQADDRGRCVVQEQVVEDEDLLPVGVVPVGSLGMAGQDGGLQLVGAGPVVCRGAGQ